MTGKLGWMERELEEFDYDSESEIENGDWVLQSGDGCFVQELSYGNFAKGTYENSNANTTTTESWTNLSGTKQRTDYEVENNEWTITDENETEIDTLEYLYNNSASTIPTNYRTITVDETAYDDWEEYFENNGLFLQGQNDIDEFIGLAESTKASIQDEIRDIRWPLNIFDMASATGGLLFQIGLTSSLIQAAGEGHHFVPKDVIKHLVTDGLIAENGDVAKVFLNNTIKPEFYSHAVDTWNNVTHVQYSSALEDVLRAYIGHLGGAVKMTADHAKDFLIWAESGTFPTAISNTLKQFIESLTGNLKTASETVKTWRMGFIQSCGLVEQIVSIGVEVDGKLVKITDKKEAKNIARVLLNNNVKEDIVKTLIGKQVLKTLKDTISVNPTLLTSLVKKGLVKILPRLISVTGVAFVAVAAQKGFANTNGNTFEKIWGAMDEGSREAMCADLIEGATQPFLDSMSNAMEIFFNGAKKTNQIYNAIKAIDE
jgi:hypothetical protein